MSDPFPKTLEEVGHARRPVSPELLEQLRLERDYDMAAYDDDIEEEDDE